MALFDPFFPDKQQAFIWSILRPIKLSKAVVFSWALSFVLQAFELFFVAVECACGTAFLERAQATQEGATIQLSGRMYLSGHWLRQTLIWRPSKPCFFLKKTAQFSHQANNVHQTMLVPNLSHIAFFVFWPHKLLFLLRWPVFLFIYNDSNLFSRLGNKWWEKENDSSFLTWRTAILGYWRILFQLVISRTVTYLSFCFFPSFLIPFFPTAFQLLAHG